MALRNTRYEFSWKVKVMINKKKHTIEGGVGKQGNNRALRRS